MFVAYALARWRFPGKILLDALVHMPLVLPPVVTGYLLLLTFGRKGTVAPGWNKPSASCFRFAGPAPHSRLP